MKTGGARYLSEGWLVGRRLPASTFPRLRVDGRRRPPVSGRAIVQTDWQDCREILSPCVRMASSAVRSVLSRRSSAATVPAADRCGPLAPSPSPPKQQQRARPACARSSARSGVTSASCRSLYTAIHPKQPITLSIIASLIELFSSLRSIPLSTKLGAFIAF